MLTVGVLPALFVGLIAAVVSWITHAEHGALSSLVATVLTLAFFTGAFGRSASSWVAELGWRWLAHSWFTSAS